MDDQSRIAEVRVNIGPAFPGDISDAVTYTLGDQIGSSVVRLNSSGGFIDKEEYYPFGDSSLRTFTYKRYRYVGKERDGESGLYYYGARYYAAWTCRFISVDPLSSKYANLSPYNYADNNPINDYDIDGMQNNNSSGTPMAAPTGSGGGVPQGNTGPAPNSTTAKTDVNNAPPSYAKPLNPTDKTTVETKKFEIKKDNVAKEKTIDFTKLEPRQPDRLYDPNSYDSPTADKLAPGVAEGQITRKAYDATDNTLMKISIIANLSSQAISNFGGSVIGGSPGGTKSQLPLSPGSGPVAGVLEISGNVRSSRAFLNYRTSGVEFVYDIATNRFAVGKPNVSLGGSPHQQLAKSIGSTEGKNVVGGIFQNQGNGIFTNENSGHFGENWTPQIRQQFQNFMNEKAGVNVNHSTWGTNGK